MTSPHTPPVGFTLDATLNEAEFEAISGYAHLPATYSYDVLRAYASSGLTGDTAEHQYLHAWTDTSSALIPLYVLPTDDPRGVLKASLDQVPSDTSNRTSRVLISGGWHWADTHIPSSGLTAPLLGRVLDGMRICASERSARIFGFVNLRHDRGLLAPLRDSGASVRLSDYTYVLPVGQYTSIDQFIAQLPNKSRSEAINNRRSAEASRLQVEIFVPTLNDRRLDSIQGLCNAQAVSHGNPDWYPAGSLKRFALSAGPAVECLLLSVDQQPIAGSVSLVGSDRYYNWAGGCNYDVTTRFNPYNLLFQTTVERAIYHQAFLIEGGRRNDIWKRRHGFHPVGLYSALFSSAPIIQ